MTKTANYQLNQWEKSDRIQMEDFNRDNCQIDAAIKNHSAFEKLLDITVPAKVSQVETDCSQIDLTQYYYVTASVEMNGSGTIGLLFNSAGSSCSCLPIGAITGNPFVACFDAGTPGGLMIPVRRQSSTPVTCLYKPSYVLGIGQQSNLTVGAIKKWIWRVNSSEYYIAAGSHFFVWGVR